MYKIKQMLWKIAKKMWEVNLLRYFICFFWGGGEGVEAVLQTCNWDERYFRIKFILFLIVICFGRNDQIFQHFFFSPPMKEKTTVIGPEGSLSLLLHAAVQLPFFQSDE